MFTIIITSIAILYNIYSETNGSIEALIITPEDIDAPRITEMTNLFP